jgi:hypothetical protein
MGAFVIGSMVRLRSRRVQRIQGEVIKNVGRETSWTVRRVEPKY